MGDAWRQLLGFMILLLLMRPAKSDNSTVLKTIFVMGATGAALKVISIGFLTDWATEAGQKVAAPTVAGSLVLVGLNFAIKKADIPFVPDNVEMIFRYILYAVGGVLMAGSTEWNKLFLDLVGLIGGGQQTAGLIGIAEDLLKILTLGLRGE